MDIIRDHKELKVYQKVFKLSGVIFQLTKSFPEEEKYSITSQIRRSSRSVGSNIAEAFRSRMYPKKFVSKLKISKAEAAETQHWLDTAYNSELIDKVSYAECRKEYDRIIGVIVNMKRTAYKWSFK